MGNGPTESQLQACWDDFETPLIEKLKCPLAFGYRRLQTMCPFMKIQVFFYPFCNLEGCGLSCGCALSMGSTRCRWRGRWRLTCVLSEPIHPSPSISPLAVICFADHYTSPCLVKQFILENWNAVMGLSSASLCCWYYPVGSKDGQVNHILSRMLASHVSRISLLSLWNPRWLALENLASLLPVWYHIVQVTKWYTITVNSELLWPNWYL